MSKPIQLKPIAALNHACDSLNLYRAELARILGLHCDEVSDSKQLLQLIHTNTDLAHKTQRFLLFFQKLEARFGQENGTAADSVEMVHWFRRHHPFLNTTPLLAMVDEGRLEDVILALESSDLALNRQPTNPA